MHTLVCDSQFENFIFYYNLMSFLLDPIGLGLNEISLMLDHSKTMRKSWKTRTNFFQRAWKFDSRTPTHICTRCFESHRKVDQSNGEETDVHTRSRGWECFFFFIFSNVTRGKKNILSGLLGKTCLSRRIPLGNVMRIVYETWHSTWVTRKRDKKRALFWREIERRCASSSIRILIRLPAFFLTYYCILSRVSIFTLWDNNDSNNKSHIASVLSNEYNGRRYLMNSIVHA